MTGRNARRYLLNEAWPVAMGSALVWRRQRQPSFAFRKE